ncbi:MAG: hypothetical protein KZQ91_13100 [Candidatus Thiodiazotropha sp. (ex Lucinoma borealis)]|nr:hypothetical protein [Candidatus Thiodiazotropha sp. (ex Lucinoma borealis)]
MTYLECGTTYYQITYADPKLTMPGLRPMVYLGMNLFGTEKEDTHYFQDTVSVLVFGLVSEATDTTDCKVSSCTENEIGVDVLSLEEAVEEIQKAAAKAKRLGYPKLKKVEGEWKQ